MQHREHARAHDREKRHGLGETVDRIPPRLIQQQQNRRDQRARMADTDPPHKVNDRESPPDRNVDTPDADALNKEPCGGRHQGLHQPESDQQAEDPSQRGLPLENDPADFVRNRRETVSLVDYRPYLDFIGQLYRLCHISFPSAPDWDCGFPSGKWFADAYSAHPAASNSSSRASTAKRGCSDRSNRRT